MLLRYEHDNQEHRIPGITREFDQQLANAIDLAADKKAAGADWLKRCRCRAMKGDLFEEKDINAVRTLCELGVTTPADAESAEIVGADVIATAPRRIAQYALDRANTANPDKNARSTPEDAAKRLAGAAKRLAPLTQLRQYEKPEWRTAHEAYLKSLANPPATVSDLTGK